VRNGEKLAKTDEIMLPNKEEPILTMDFPHKALGNVDTVGCNWKLRCGFAALY